MATSLASSVGTRVESASRHMLQCRVHKDRFLSWNLDNEKLRKNKHVYSMTKDELVVDSASSMFPAGDHICKQPHPYPRVVTTWSGIDPKIMSAYCVLMAQDMPDYFEMLDHLTRHAGDAIVPDDLQAMLLRMKPSENDQKWGDTIRIEDVSDAVLHSLDVSRHKFHTLPDFRVMGYSVGTAYAHEYNGDTIASVMIGGLVTVQNGAYAMHTGDPVCWYVQYAEEVCFDEYGKRFSAPKSTIRLLDSIVNGVKHIRPKGKQGHSMRNSGFGDASLKDNVFLPKPFFYINASFGDTRRVFGKCLSSAAPYEKVDIMIASQSI
jgi:hypothetical protein